MIFFRFLFFSLLFISYSVFSKSLKPPFHLIKPSFNQIRWVDSVYQSLTLDEKIAQLFMVPAYSNKNKEHPPEETKELIAKYNVGGLIFMQGGPKHEAALTNLYQKLAKTPLMIAMDAEWGLSMRIDSVPKYPRQMTLGAIANDSLIYEMGKQIGIDCNHLGIHINFAPVVDINNNPLNPVIGMRSFGESKYNVTKKSMMYMNGLQDANVMTCIKHFPGHGDTEFDSHKTLPTLSFSQTRLDTLELYPYKKLIPAGAQSIMIAHLFVPTLDSIANVPASLSSNVINGLVKKQLQFKGLVFTDALNMKAVSDNYKSGELELKALMAGNDVLLFSENVKDGIEKIKAAILDSILLEKEIEEKCKKILHAKYCFKLYQLQTINTNNIVQQLNATASHTLNTKLAEASITLLKNTNNIIPLKLSDTIQVAEVNIGDKETNLFSEYLHKYKVFKHFKLALNATQIQIDTLINQLKKYQLIILQINKTTSKISNNYGLSDACLDFINTICVNKKTIVCLFSNPYLINKLPKLVDAQAVLSAYEYNEFSQTAAVHAIFGANAINGTLPIATNIFSLSTGVKQPKINNYKFVQPIDLGINTITLAKIDSIAMAGVSSKIYPGCQIVAIKNGQVFYQKSFGKLTYDSTSNNINNNTQYDLASLTKILSSALAIMKLNDDKKLNINKTLGYYLPDLKKTNKYKLNIAHILTHQAGLKAWIPYYLETFDKNKKLSAVFYSKNYSPIFNIKVADSLYVINSIKDSIYKSFNASSIDPKPRYLYSDIGYYYMLKIIENASKLSLDEYVRRYFYKPLNLNVTYTPLNLPFDIAPTEVDTYFRNQNLKGYVHDQGAALLGGVGGHAGLFGNALDVAIIMQMLLNKGNYNGFEFIKSKTVEKFTATQFKGNRRGLCFDKPDSKEGNVSELCSFSSFGHSGFTGTFAWADPKNNLVYVFLSNRTYPNDQINKLAKSKIRAQIHTLFYEAIK